MAEYKNTISKPKPIATLAELRAHLQTALILEHATIPAYLTALYSIKEGSNIEAALVIRSVVVEEMLHLTLAANVLNAVGGRPNINSKGFVPEYPTRLPHSANRFLVNLERFSKDAIEIFMAIEHPAYGKDPLPQPDQYDTIGQFYAAIKVGIDKLCGEHNQNVHSVFTGQLSRQVGAEQYYGSGGKIIVVHDKQSAFAAIDEIVSQGEGSDHGHKIWETPRMKLSVPREQVAHFYRFDEIRQECYYKEGDKPLHPTGDDLQVDWDAVWPIRSNTKSSDFPEGSETRATLDDFNRYYTGFLNTLHAAFNGQPELIASTIPRMYDLKYMVQAIAGIPVEGSDETVGPSWERVAD